MVAFEVAAAVVLWGVMGRLVLQQIDFRPRPTATAEWRSLGTGIGSYAVDYTGYPTGSVTAAAKDVAPAAVMDAADETFFPDAADALLASLSGPAPEEAATEDHPATPPDADAAALAFLAERERVEGLRFRIARGFWRNTYRPGDPELRWLVGRSDFAREAAAPGGLAHRSRQPLDAPEGSALALSLRADRRGASERSRLLVQVALKGTPRRPGRRTAMAVALVIARNGATAPEDAGRLEALALALARARDLGDRFHLYVTGAPGGMLVGPDDFRHGQVRAVLREALSRPRADGLDLAGATAQAAAVVGATITSDEAGAGLVLVATAGVLGADTDALLATARDASMRGIPVGAVGAGPGVVAEELDRLVLAGRGRRYALETAGDADAIVAAELQAAGQIVARGIRLAVRLAPGVELHDVLQSERLVAGDGAVEASEAERRLSRELGLPVSPRIPDDGIQIFVPAFRAGDAHTILLDVVVPGPGPVADASLHYRDLVWARPAAHRVHLALGREDAGRSPLEVAVLKDLLGARVGQALGRAAALVEAGKGDEARALLTATRQVVDRLPLHVPGLLGDPDVTDDLALLDALLARLPGATVETAHDLRCAARLKVLPPPA